MNELENQSQPHKSKEHEITIIVNATEQVVDDKDITYLEVVQLCFPSAVIGGNVIYTVTYKKGTSSNQQGAMDIGDTVKIKKGMIFNVTPTDKS
ncbi:MAG: multiubiquitin domain-containing protein [Methylotenera sp.]|uniref:multiubiquitin domain-containing protein n=1 Tax=Methylotenera sp. TaxID=2051956 RepID=UPI00271E2BF6|nr:multiubiquitin domain-containing protein [Methylotenera sp.]MDO9151045.1 multiubiquitin domain-containing protein [Methylotenera sp.]MDP3777753.1 multiubiquitin domain-containing protein [Methylotenera sp.]